MATIKVACPKCGQKVSGDESFFGSSVECPVCSADIRFPGEKRAESEFPRGELTLEEQGVSPTPPDRESPAGYLPEADFEAAPQPLSAREGEYRRIDAETAIPLEHFEDNDHGASSSGAAPSPIFGAISMVSAVLAVVTCVGGILFGPIAIIFGHMALARARHSPVQPAPGHTLGAIGTIVGYVSLFLWIVLLAVAVFFGEPIREYFNNSQ